LGGLRPPNTPYLPINHGDSQITKISRQFVPAGEDRVLKTSIRLYLRSQ
jgi:hypothetical protein